MAQPTIGASTTNSCGNIHTTLDNEEVDWDFDTHSEKGIEKIAIKKK